MRRPSPTRRQTDESGQGVIEYILLLFIISLGVLGTLQMLKGLKIKGKTLPEYMTLPIRDSFARTYRYGHPKALGYEDGGPVNHPRAVSPGNNNFRIFIHTRPN